MAAIACYEEVGAAAAVRPMRILSFENDLDSLELAFRHSDKFSYLRHSAPAWLLRQGCWQSREYSGLSWEVIKGDFLLTLESAPAPPELIFYDMFSSKTCGAHWSLETFARLLKACRQQPVALFTYSCSTAARVAMLAAGFWVARGRASGEKQETTVALTPEAAAAGWGKAYEFLGDEWLRKWNRSSARYPAELPVEAHTHFAEKLSGHPQFRGQPAVAD